MKIDIDEHERKARAALLGEASWRWLDPIPGISDPETLERVPDDGEFILVADGHVRDEDKDHIAANSPPVTLALIARIRELEESLRMLPWPVGEDSEIKALLEKGAVLS